MKINRQILKKILTVIVILALATSLAFAMREFGIRTENILLVYIGAVLLINIETKSLGIGMISAFICVGIFNFLFTEPLYTFIISDPNYYISMLIFVIVTIIINTLSSSLQKQIAISNISEKRSTLLNRINKLLLNAHSYQEIAQYMQTALEDMLSREVIVWMQSVDSVIYHPLDIHTDLHREKVEWCIQHSTICGHNKVAFPDSKYEYYPFRTKQDKGINGSVILFVENSELNVKEITFIDAAISSLLIACDREHSTSEKEQTRLKMEKEKFKSSLLRSISHDIKTPLTSITAGSSLLLEGYSSITEPERIRLLKDINNESLYMADFVNNLLNMTKIDADRLTIEKHHEIVEDVLAEVMKHIHGRLGNHQLLISKKKEVLFVDVDHQLIVQVLVNLIDNSIKHTNPNSKILIDYYVENNALFFEIKDNGGGLDEAKMEHLFEDFVSVKAGKADKSRGTGLGLYICSAIIKAHGGEIHAYNNDIGGATFKFYIPYVENEGNINE